MLLTLGALSGFSQLNTYPKTKKIGQDSVVIITIKQADEINNAFRTYRDSIEISRDSMAKQKKLLDSLRLVHYNLQNAPNEYKWRYEANREIYLRREKSIQEDKKWSTFASLGLIGIILLQFFYLK